MLLRTLSLLAAAAAAPLQLPAKPPCRDRLLQPFAASSIWNTAIGSGARYVAAGIYPLPPGPPPAPVDMCVAGAANPALRTGCRGWLPTWNTTACRAAGCCYDEHPNPDPHHYAWCFANCSAPRGDAPARFYVDQDYMITAAPTDPETPFIDQGWWGSDAKCGRDHCCLTGRQVGTLPFPAAWTINMTSNNAAALLLPDRTTLVQFQPLVRCTAGSPILGLHFFFNIYPNISIFGPGIWGAHGGSHLSSIGGTIRKGELLPRAPPIPHALKLMLWAKRYYWPGNATIPCWRWPATNCDGAWNASRDPANSNFYNGSSTKLKPGALLAVPPLLAPRGLRTEVAKRILAALVDYGGYLDDNTASDSGAFNVEGGVIDEVKQAWSGLRIAGAAPGEPFYEDMLKVFRALHIVDNNALGAIGGGGTPRQPVAPPICDDDDVAILKTDDDFSPLPSSSEAGAVTTVVVGGAKPVLVVRDEHLSYNVGRRSARRYLMDTLPAAVLVLTAAILGVGPACAALAPAALRADGGQPVGDASGRRGSHLRYFSVWEPDYSGPKPDQDNSAQQKGWLNFLFTSTNATTIRQYWEHAAIPGMLHVRPTFFCGDREAVLCPDWQQRWAAQLVSTVQPMLAEGSLFGIFIGDEIVGAGVPFANLSAVVDKIRSDLPRGKAILYCNEAAPVVWDAADFYYPHVPTGLDWISLDYYPDAGTAAGYRRLYDNALYGLMSKQQMALIVPPAYGFNGYDDGDKPCAQGMDKAACADQTCCSNHTRDGPNPPCHGNCTAAMLQWAAFTYDWAREDTRIVGLAPWHWESRQNGPMQPGMERMPAVLAAFQQIGAEIVSGRLRDLDFDSSSAPLFPATHGDSAQAGGSSTAATAGAKVWPRPTHAVSAGAGGTTICFSNFVFVIGTDSPDGVLRKAAARYRGIIFAQSGSVPRVAADGEPYKITLVVADGSVPLSPGPEMNETYVLDAAAAGCTITAHSVWGALRGLETLSQLVKPGAAGFLVENPIMITDRPRFGWRGLMIDTGRNYLTVTTIKMALDAMSYTKLNLLHWHMVDDQSFAIKSEALPKLAGFGAFSPKHAYSLADLRTVVAYGRERGIAVLPGVQPLQPDPSVGSFFEFNDGRTVLLHAIVALFLSLSLSVSLSELDMPGHSTSWTRGYPAIRSRCPQQAGEETTPMDPTANATYALISTLLAELDPIFPTEFPYWHMGGDEVRYGCWNSSDGGYVQKFMKANGIAAGDYAGLQNYFEQKVIDLVGALPSRKRTVLWEEDTRGSGHSIAGLPKDSVVNLFHEDNGRCAGSHHAFAKSQFILLQSHDSFDNALLWMCLDRIRRRTCAGCNGAQWVEGVLHDTRLVFRPRQDPHRRFMGVRLWLGAVRQFHADRGRTRCRCSRCRVMHVVAALRLCELYDRGIPQGGGGGRAAVERARRHGRG